MTIEQLMVDAIDLHVHHAPDTHAPDSLMRSRADALEAAKQARQMRMRAIGLKNHDYPTAPLATMVSQLVPEVKVFGSICLDYEVGGLNFHALAASAKLGARVVWMPTHSSRNAMAKTSRLTGVSPEAEGLYILNPVCFMAV